MIKAEIVKIDLNSGKGICKLENSSKENSFNVLKLQDGDQTNFYKLKVGQNIYFGQDIEINQDFINESYYLFDWEEKQQIVKNMYENPDRSALVGDLVITHEGLKRVAKIDEEMVQLGYGKPYIYLDDGGASYSGGLEYPFSVKEMIDTGRFESASFWTFKDGSRAHNGMDFEILVKVWKVNS